MFAHKHVTVYAGVECDKQANVAEGVSLDTQDMPTRSFEDSKPHTSLRDPIREHLLWDALGRPEHP